MIFDKKIFGGHMDSEDTEGGDLFPLFSQQEEKESNKLTVPEVCQSYRFATLFYFQVLYFQ